MHAVPFSSSTLHVWLLSVNKNYGYICYVLAYIWFYWAHTVWLNVCACTYELIHLCTLCAQVHIRTHHHSDCIEHTTIGLSIFLLFDYRWKGRRLGSTRMWMWTNSNMLCSNAKEIKRASMIDWVVAQHSSTIWVCRKKCNTNSLHNMQNS